MKQDAINGRQPRNTTTTGTRGRRGEPPARADAAATEPQGPGGPGRPAGARAVARQWAWEEDNHADGLGVGPFPAQRKPPKRAHRRPPGVDGRSGRRPAQERLTRAEGEHAGAGRRPSPFARPRSAWTTADPRRRPVPPENALATARRAVLRSACSPSPAQRERAGVGPRTWTRPRGSRRPRPRSRRRARPSSPRPTAGER